MKKPIVIAIAAVSGGGKTTVTKLVSEQLQNAKAFFFNDFESNGSENFIEWMRRNAESTATVKYTDISEFLDGCASSPEYIVFDYSFGYMNSSMKDAIDISIFIDTPLDIAMARRITGSLSGMPKDDIMFNMQMYLTDTRDAYVTMMNKVKDSSDIVIDGSLDKQVIADKILSVVDMYKRTGTVYD
jgi:uridine kinase